jgi:dolichyl-phosphate-mannose-protein mannosyltransferase
VVLIASMKTSSSFSKTSRDVHPALVFALIFIALFILHWPLLRLPYFWDEAGYYIPAARDLFLSGTLIPSTTVTNAHPPLVMAWLALWWKVLGFTPVVTRTAMLLIAAFALLGMFRLAERVSGRQVAIASTVCTALYPVFYAQSSLAHLDLAAAGFTFWALRSYVEDRRWLAVIWFAFAGMCKETAILASLAILVWELAAPQILNPVAGKRWCLFPASARSWLLLFPVAPLAVWFAYHFHQTGHVFGNPEFFRYNVEATLHPLRFVLVLGLRLWQVLAYVHLYFLTFAAFVAMRSDPIRDAIVERPRIALPVQAIFAVVIATYVVAMAILGGAVLARYMLPAVPLVILICVSTVWRRIRRWREVIGFVCVMFVAGWFWNPPYGFSPEDNLAYRDYILLHDKAEDFLEARYPMARVLTAWPASDEISRPFLGYVDRPMRVVRIENFSLDSVVLASYSSEQYDVALLFSTKYEPAFNPIGHWQPWEEIKTRFFDYHRDLPPQVAASLLGGKVIYSDRRQSQWIAVVTIDRVQNARQLPSPPLSVR